MDVGNLADLRKWFSNYVAGYSTDDSCHDEAVRLKEEHTERVCKEIVRLGGALNLPTQDLLLAEIMALFHDLGASSLP